ncbi:hypothetical protein CBR_g22472 [Chara braunii]|uniref:Uncharacterized protein n=1 Tax=Chara braunii TaxID=69332 RepID=A0A388L315_CHABU|nr:hypothetical protein CBR_g22472 [Chara braunii]|eukprot:GBG76593.1 hypothetical protein CBR_g22472 [Chara braunii]
MAHSLMARSDGATTSGQAVRDDALLARILHEHEEMKVKMEVAEVANKRAESLEEALRLMKQRHEDALQEAETWKKEALQSDNKRSRVAISPSSQLRMPPAATPRKTPAERPPCDPSQLVHLHALEVNALKELRLQELNRRREAEKENAKLKEELARRDAGPKSPFQQKLDDAGGSVARTSRAKKKTIEDDESGKENERGVFYSRSKERVRQ